MVESNDIDSFSADVAQALDGAVNQAKSISYAKIAGKLVAKTKFNYRVTDETGAEAISEDLFKSFFGALTRNIFDFSRKNSKMLQVLFYRKATGHMRIQADDRETIMWATNHFKATVINGKSLKIVVPEIIQGHKAVLYIVDEYGAMPFDDIAGDLVRLNGLRGNAKLIAKRAILDSRRKDWRRMVVILDVDDDCKQSINEVGNKVFFGPSDFEVKFPGSESKGPSKRTKPPNQTTLGDLLVSAKIYGEYSKYQKQRYRSKLRVFLGRQQDESLDCLTVEGALGAGIDLQMMKVGSGPSSKRTKITEANDTDKNKDRNTPEDVKAQGVDPVTSEVATSRSSRPHCAKAESVSAEEVKAGVSKESEKVKADECSGDEWRQRKLAKSQELNIAKAKKAATSKANKNKPGGSLNSQSSIDSYYKKK